ncbi:MAG: DUF1934 domain-containing protein [Acidaminococcaceae bacterium]|nr:DUF1934 domain-containing protein [Acidaminococcaceae bacterium]
MQAVKITVCSSSDVAGEEKLEVVSFGTLHEKNGSWYARYQESELTGLAGTMTTIKWDRERIIVLRSGGVEHRQEFFPGLSQASLYKTPELTIPLQTRTRTVTITALPAGAWQLDIDYELLYGAAESNQRQLRIRIEEDKRREH